MTTHEPIDAAFVRHWAAKYPANADSHVLGVIHPAVKDQRYYTDEQARQVLGWKSTRSLGYLGRNHDGDIEAVTSMALNGPAHLAHRVLRVLHGVLDPVASSLLMVFDPDRFTVIDRYAIHALRVHGEWPDQRRWPDYPTYVDLCGHIAERTGNDLRTLDRALWAWGEAHN